MDRKDLEPEPRTLGAAVGSSDCCPGNGAAKQANPIQGRPHARLLAWYCALVAEAPIKMGCAVIFTGLVLCLLPSFICCGRALVCEDLIVVDPGFDPKIYQIRGTEISNREESVEAMDCGYACRRLRHDKGHVQQYNVYRRRLNASGEIAPTERESLVVVYVSRDGSNMLTEGRLVQALNMERAVVAAGLGEPSVSTLPKFFPNYPDYTGALSGQALLNQLANLTGGAQALGHVAGSWSAFDGNFSACNLQSSLLSTTFSAPEVDNMQRIFSHSLPEITGEDLYLAFWPETDFWFDFERENYLMRDMMLLCAVAASSLALLMFITCDPCLSFSGFFIMQLAFGLAFSAYRLFVGPWFGLLNVFSAFLLLGIGCDDIFVLHDVWRQATQLGGVKENDCRGRLMYTLPRAGRAILTTSLTTAVAFFGNSVSNIPPLRVFGILAGFVVVADFVLTMLFLPSILVLQSRCRREVPGTSACCRHASAESAFAKLASCTFRCALPIVVGTAVASAVCAHVGLEIQPGRQWHNSQLFPPEHNQRRAAAAKEAMAAGVTRYATVNIVHGVLPSDSANWNDPGAGATVTWDPSFDIFDPGVQPFTLELCSALLSDTALVRRVISCWALSLQDTFLDGDLPGHGGENVSSSLQNKEVQSALLRMPGVRVSRRICGSGTCEFVQAVRIEVETSLPEQADASEQRFHYRKWDSLMKSWNKKAAARGIHALSRGFQSSKVWVQMATIESLAASCVSSILMSMVLVVVILLSILRNWLVVLLVVLHVLAICSAVLTIWVAQGRALGMLESISLTLVVGLSVDYLTHLAVAYVEEPMDASRQLRTLGAVTRLGGSVMGGATTTASSAAFLLLANLLFFSQLGQLIVTIIILSFVFALFPFVASLFFFGPEGKFGEILFLERAPRQNVQYLYLEEGSPGLDPVDNGMPALLHDMQIPSRRVRVCLCLFFSLLLIGTVALRVAAFLRKANGDQTVRSPCTQRSELLLNLSMSLAQAPGLIHLCSGFQDVVAHGCTYYVSRVEPVVASQSPIPVITAQLFESVDVAPSCPSMCARTPANAALEAALLVGEGGFQWADGMAYAMGSGSRELQVYAKTNGGISHKTVVGGLRLQLVPEPKHVITTLAVGLHPHGELIIPPRQANTTVSVECVPNLLGNVTVVAYAPFAHQLASRITTQVWRRDGRFGLPRLVGDVGRSEEQSYTHQRVQKFEPGAYRQIMPGDTIRVYCSYDSLSRSQSTAGGAAEEDEMCSVHLYVFPARSVQSRQCLSHRVHYHTAPVENDGEHHARRGGKCTASDQANFMAHGAGNNQNSSAWIARKCAYQTFSWRRGFAQEKFVKCFSSRVGITEPCSACFAVHNGMYAFSHCKTKCIVKWCSPRCLACMYQNEDAVAKCTGLSIDERPKAEPC